MSRRTLECNHTSKALAGRQCLGAGGALLGRENSLEIEHLPFRKHCPHILIPAGRPERSMPPRRPQPPGCGPLSPAQASGKRGHSPDHCLPHQPLYVSSREGLTFCSGTPPPTPLRLVLQRGRESTGLASRLPGLGSPCHPVLPKILGTLHLSSLTCNPEIRVVPIS